jgi:hypothetical protein
MALNHAYRYGDRDRPGWRIAFDYDEDDIESLKHDVPPSHRRWYPEDKEWWVSVEYEDVIVSLFRDFEAYLRQPNLL